jgi:hypothetical protein
MSDTSAGAIIAPAEILIVSGLLRITDDPPPTAVHAWWDDIKKLRRTVVFSMPPNNAVRIPH